MLEKSLTVLKQSFFLDWIHFERVTHTCFPFEGDIHSTCQNPGNFFPRKKIKRVSDLNFFALLCALCHNRICQTWWTSFTCHFLFSHWRPKRERWTFSCARDCQTPVFLRVETERQFHNFYYWMFCLIKKAVLQND